MAEPNPDGRLMTRRLYLPPHLVTAARWLHHNGWTRTEWQYTHPSNGMVICWDWHLPGAEASHIAPTGATWRLEVSQRHDDGRWVDLLVAEVHSVSNTVDLLVSVYILPPHMHSAWGYAMSRIQADDGSAFCDANHRLAAIYFTAEHESGLRAAGTPDDGVEHLRLTYIRDAAASPEAMRQIQEWAANRGGDGQAEGE